MVLKRLAGLNDNPSATPDAKDKRFNKTPRDQDARLATAITSKLEAGNFRTAVRLLCSDDVPAPTNAGTLQALQDKHPSAPLDRKPACSPTGNLRFQPLQVSPDDVIKCLRTFPAASSGDPDGLTEQHITDILDSAADDKLRTTLTDFVNLLLVGELPIEVRLILYGGRLIALQTKGWRDTAHRCGLHAETFDSKVREHLCYQKKERGAANNTRWRRCLGSRRSRCTRNPSSHVEPTRQPCLR